MSSACEWASVGLCRKCELVCIFPKRRYQGELARERQKVSRFEIRHDAFSHSEQCDALYSTASPLPGGVSHKGCRCWCHNTEHLRDSPGPELDLTPPPEYATSADAPFLEPPGLHDRKVELTEPEPEEYAVYTEDSYLDTPVDPATIVAEVIPVSATGYSGWSPVELASGKCSNCNDSLTVCECIE